MVTLVFSEADRDRVSAAIAAAEARSDGEILAIATEVSDSYHDVGLHYAVGVMFLAMAVIAAWPAYLHWWVERLSGGWTEPSERALFTIVLGVLLAKFLGTLFLMKWRPLRLALTPGATKERRVRRRAVALFKAAAQKRTIGRTGVLIYLSAGERRAEIIGDEAVTKVADGDCWAEAMAVLLAEVRAGRPGDGLVGAIERVGGVLASHFPKTATDSNEIPDKLIEL
ncbi:hypothetical protein ABDK56_03925 [Sphingomonas sp. ASV193]|uniref:TPM domain-containing protein n=1 Tax=Sphingomonas sp. ASV193 TaxID=3144405 RepID=UPI0032E91E7B